MYYRGKILVIIKLLQVVSYLSLFYCTFLKFVRGMCSHPVGDVAQNNKVNFSKIILKIHNVNVFQHFLLLSYIFLIFPIFGNLDFM